MEAIPGSVENESELIGEVVETAGESFADGSVIEPVSFSTDKTVALLSWAPDRGSTVTPCVRRDGKVYELVKVHPSVWESTALPTGPVERGPLRNLFSETRQLVQNYVGLPPAEAALATAWNATTWFADILPNPPALFVHGIDMSLAIGLFRVFNCIGRHPLMVTEFDRTALRSLMLLQPTLLINQAQMSPRLRALCRASNFRGVVVPGSRGEVLDLVSSKAIFVGTETGALNEPGLHLHLPPARAGLPPLDAAAQRQIKERFQPWYLWHRLRNLPEVRQGRFPGGALASSTAEVRSLQLCTQNCAPLKLQWASLLRRQEEDAHAEKYWDAFSAMLEFLWPRLHSSEKSISIKELTDFTNTLLRSRGENREYSPEELGIKLRNQGVLRRRRSSGMFLRFDRQTLHRLHQLARGSGVGEIVKGCPDCSETHK